MPEDRVVSVSDGRRQSNIKSSLALVALALLGAGQLYATQATVHANDPCNWFPSDYCQDAGCGGTCTPSSPGSTGQPCWCGA